MSYPPPGPGPYRPPPPYRPQPPKKKVHPLLIGCGAIGALFVVLVVIGAIVGSTKKNNQSASSAAPPAVTSAAPAASKTAVKAPVSAPAQPAPKPVTVLTEHGTGIKSTASFTVHDDWDLSYAFDCSTFGSQGNFIVTINGSGGDVLANTIATKGSDITHQHDGPGKIALDVNSECAWTIRVIQLP